MRKPREARASRSCREIRKNNRNKLQDLVGQLQYTLKGTPPKIPAAKAFITGHLNKILLALGYEASMVEMLGQKYGS
jgi:hypothetical protein